MLSLLAQMKAESERNAAAIAELEQACRDAREGLPARAEAPSPAAAARSASGQLGRFLELAGRSANVPTVGAPPSALRWPQPLRAT